MLSKTPVTQRSPCYSAVSALLRNPLPDRSNYSPLLPHPLPHSGSILYFTSLFRPDPLPSRYAGDYHCCSALLQNLVGNSGETWCLEEAEQQAEASVDFPYPPLQIVNSVPFSLYIYPLSSPSLHHPFFLFFVLQDKDFKFHYILFHQWHIFFAFCFTPWHIFLIMHWKKQILLLELQLAEETMATSQGRIYKIKKGGLSGPPSLQIVFLSLSPLCSLSQYSLFSLSSFPLASLPSLLAPLLSSLDKHHHVSFS